MIFWVVMLCSLVEIHFFINNQEYLLTNSAVDSVKTRNKHHLHSSIAYLSCFQKRAYYTGITIFSNLPFSLKKLLNEKAQLK
jgi:ABC-type transporter Mla maintaining outer membrane lipid asymmetry ATPase subunit MlaF